MPNTEARTEKLNEALAHLNEAAKERREELQTLVADKYTDLRSAFGGAAQASGRWVKEHGREVADTAKLAAVTVDRSARRYPWRYVGGAAASGLLLGFLLGRTGKRTTA